MPLTIATCICTMNRPGDLRRAITSLAACDPPPGRVMVSDDSPEADRRSEAVCSEFPGAIYQRGPRCGLGENRNAAVAAAGDAEWIHFIDDDVTVPPDFYRQVVDVIAGVRGRAVVSGVERRYASLTDPSPLTVTPPRAGFWAHLEDPRGRAANCVVINAALFPRELLVRSPFDGRMKYGCEESDITCNAISQGYTLITDPRLVVDHFPAAENRSVYRGWVVASQVYAGLKRQWFYEHSRSSAIAFLALAVPRLVLYYAHHNGPRAGLSAAGQAMRGVKYFVAALLEGRHVPQLHGGLPKA